MSDIRDVYGAAVSLKAKLREIDEIIEVLVNFFDEYIKNNSEYKLKNLQDKDKLDH